MIVEELADRIRLQSRDIWIHENRRPSFLIYMPNEIWCNMMYEVYSLKEASMIQLELYHSRGDSIMGQKIYRVLTDETEIRIFEVQNA